MIYGHGVVSPAHLWGAWSWEPSVLAGLALAATAYGLGVTRLWSSGGGRILAVRHVVAFYAGLACLFVALVSPLDALSDTLFSAHMVQHLMLMLGAAPLLVCGAPVLPMSLLLPLSARRRVRALERARIVRAGRRVATSPIVAWTLLAGALWSWHLPRLYQSALTSNGMHVLEHTSFLVTSLLFWWLILSSAQRRRLGYGAGVLLVFTTTLQSSCLGVILAFATTILYPLHAAGAQAWGLTPLEDQQLAGMLMWVPPGMVYLVTMAVLFVRWLKEVERRMERAESLDRNAFAFRPGPR